MADFTATSELRPMSELTEMPWDPDFEDWKEGNKTAAITIKALRRAATEQYYLLINAKEAARQEVANKEVRRTGLLTMYR